MFHVCRSHEKASQGIHNSFSNNTKWHEKKNAVSVPVKTEAYSETSQISDMKLFAKLVNDWKLLTFSQKALASDVWRGSEYTSDKNFISDIWGLCKKNVDVLI